MSSRTAGHQVVALVAVIGVILVSAVVVAPPAGANPPVRSAADRTPTSVGNVSFLPGPVGGLFSDQQAVQVIVTPNFTLPAGSSFQMLECADTGGVPSGLPKNNSACDHHTLETATIPRNAEGGMVVVSYTFHLVPDPTLGEKPHHTPMCDDAHACVLYVGRDNRDFRKPKIFSAPFFLSPIPPQNVPEAPVAVLLPVAGVVSGGGVLFCTRRRRRHSSPPVP